MNIAKNISFFAISIALIGGITYNLLRSPCNTPLTYSIDRIDKEFNISKDDIQKYTDAGAKLWNDAEGKEILKSDVNGKIKISLIYDERQRETIKANRIKAQIEEDKKDLSDIKNNIDEMKSIFEQREKAYEDRVDIYKKRLEKYNSDVSYWNGKGGAPQSEYDRLQNERAYLENENSAISKDASDLQQLANKINENVKSNNSIVDTVNSKIQEINKNAGREFEEGVYNSKDKTITIYQYADIADLKRVLAHELGHAIGLDHTENKESIMYYLNTGKVFKLSQEDKDELHKICSHSYLFMMISRISKNA